MGWLLRNLQSFGEQLVFENVLDDGRVELALTSLFATLLKRGALSGRQVTDAVTITRRDAGQSNAVAFDIGCGHCRCGRNHPAELHGRHGDDDDDDDDVGAGGMSTDVFVPFRFQVSLTGSSLPAGTWGRDRCAVAASARRAGWKPP